MKFIQKEKKNKKNNKSENKIKKLPNFKNDEKVKLGSAQKKRVKKRIEKKLKKLKANNDIINLKEDKPQKIKNNDDEINDTEVMNTSDSNPFNLNDIEEELNLNESIDSDVESIEEESKDVKDDVEKSDITTNVIAVDHDIKITDLDSLNTRIQSNTEILSNFKAYKKSHEGLCHPRKFYVRQWLDDISIRFSYNRFLLNKFYQIFNMDLVRFLIASEEERPLTIRTNTLKTSRRRLSEILLNKDCNVENLQFSKVGMVIHSSKCSIGSTSEYLAGHYILQGSSSMLPVMALAPKPGEKILDLCAAPGGKSTHIAQIMKNTGILYVNDNNKDRLMAVKGNLARMGVINALVTCHDGRSIHKKIRNCDRVLCDAPCTGTGVISKDKSIKASKDESDLKALTIIQKQLLCAAIDACKVGGFVVYSTCSLLVEENEQVIDYACRKRNVKIIETGLFGISGFVNFCSKHFNDKMRRTRRYYPHENNMDGFFVGKLQKLQNVEKKENVQ